MKKLLFILFLLTLGFSIQAQTVKVKAYNKDYEKYRTSHNFDYIHDELPDSMVTWVADIIVEFDTVIPGMIGESYKKLKERAVKAGANAFKVKDSDIFTITPDKYILVSVYWLRMENRNQNMSLHRDNRVYLFGFLGYHKEIAGYDVTIQKDKVIMHALTYREYEYPVKTNVNIQLGSKTRGTKISFRMEERMYPKFIYFNMLKGSFKNAYIDEYSLSFGLFLKNILEPDS